MILLAVISLLLGIFCGGWLFSPELSAQMGGWSGYALNLLSISVGISVGANKTILRHMRENSKLVLVIPAGVIVSSLVGGALCGLLVGEPINLGMAIAAGLGWYSLSGVMLTELAGAQAGTLTFLANVFREIFSFLVIPMVSRHLNGYAAIASAAATSEDTTLPMIMRCTNEQTAVISVLNGVLCSLAVPFLIQFSFYLG